MVSALQFCKSPKIGLSVQLIGTLAHASASPATCCGVASKFLIGRVGMSLVYPASYKPRPQKTLHLGYMSNVVSSSLLTLLEPLVVSLSQYAAIYNRHVVMQKASRKQKPHCCSLVQALRMLSMVVFKTWYA